MALPDLASCITMTQAHPPASYSIGTVNSSGIDCRGMYSAVIIFSNGTVGGGETVDVTIETSSDDGSGDAYTAVTGAAFTQATGARDDVTYTGRLILTNAERYIRVVGVTAGGAVIWGCNVILFPEDTRLADTIDWQV